jgi:hypothetical protein
MQSAKCKMNATTVGGPQSFGPRPDVVTRDQTLFYHESLSRSFCILHFAFSMYSDPPQRSSKWTSKLWHFVPYVLTSIDKRAAITYPKARVVLEKEMVENFFDALALVSIEWHKNC